LLTFKKYLTSLIIVLALLLGAWYVSLQLTKQRVQLESINRLNNLEKLSTPYFWDFKSFEDVVGSFQYYWQKPVGENFIHAKKASNPQLSLNFSGESINTYHHSQLVIHSNSGLHGALKLQTKTNLEDGNYYYLSDIILSGATQTIDLHKLWDGLNKDGKVITQLEWNQITPHMTSLVLQFTNQDDELHIDSISMPYSANLREAEVNTKVNCLGKFDSSLTPDIKTRYIFTLSESCWLPSRYMWLNDTIRKSFPGSILKIDDMRPMLQPSLHKINKPYSQNFSINAILYVYLAFFLLAVYFLLRYNKSIREPEKEETWYKWLASQVLFRGINKAVSPYHFVLNYLVVLIPTLLIIVVMSFIVLPDLTTFQYFPMYFLWAVLQQFVLGYVLAERIFYAKTNNRLVASLLAAAVFAIFHMPSVVLMLATFIAGGLWAYAWLVFKRIIPLAISHSLLALMFYYVTNNNFLYSAKVLQWFWE
jgi:flagellar biogenesis protein FliO